MAKGENYSDWTESREKVAPDIVVERQHIGKVDGCDQSRWIAML